MKVAMIGCGKLGLPVALAIESKGHKVMGYDVNSAFAGYVANREIPYVEEGLQPLLDTTNLHVARSVDECVEFADLLFIAVQTPHDPKYEGSTRIPYDRKDFNYAYIKEALSEVSEACRRQEKKCVVAVISTCLPGTFKRELEQYINEYVSYVYTPQFIAMGTVLNDYLNPEFNLIGVHDAEAAKTLEAFYKTINQASALVTDITTAEAIKVSYNTFITMKTVLANTWGELCHKVGANVDDVTKAWSMSSKRLLSPKYLQAGMGDGGGCHPRDNIALSYIASECDLSHNIFEDLMRAREDHAEWLASLTFDTAKKARLPIVLLGRSFKPETNIETGSPAVLVANILLQAYTRDVEHVEDKSVLKKAVYLITTRHERYTSYSFPTGSTVIDPFRYIPDAEGIKVIRLGSGQ